MENTMDSPFRTAVLSLVAFALALLAAAVIFTGCRYAPGPCSDPVVHPTDEQSGGAPAGGRSISEPFVPWWIEEQWQEAR